MGTSHSSLRDGALKYVRGGLGHGCNVYHTKIQTGGRWRYKLTVTLKFAKSKPYKDTKFKVGRWRYNVQRKLKFAKSTIQRYNNSRVDVGVAKSTIQRYKKSGRWHYRLTA